MVSVVHVNKGQLAGPFDLNGRVVETITAFLFQAGGDDDPARLAENANKSFQGSVVLGMGFTFDDTDKKGIANPISLMNDLIRKDPNNAERIFPYIGGEEVNSSPIHAYHRYVIGFEKMSETEARRWPDLMSLLERTVKPDRLSLGDVGDAGRRKEHWWLWGRYTPSLFSAAQRLERVLVNSQVSKYLCFAFVPGSLVYGHTLNVFADDSFALFSLLQSRVHEVWARAFASSLEDRLRYTPSDCFETFPRPPRLASLDALEIAGRDYYECRAALMVRNNEGMTDTYGRFHDPADQDPGIIRLRALQDAMDRTAMAAYGWPTDLPVCDFLLDSQDDVEPEPERPNRRKDPRRLRWPDEYCDQVLQRLLELNAARSTASEAALTGGAAAPKMRKGTTLTTTASGRLWDDAT